MTLCREIGEENHFPMQYVLYAFNLLIINIVYVLK